MVNKIQQDYTKKVEKSIIDWESLKTTNILLDTIARHLAVIADWIEGEKKNEMPVENNER